MDIKIESPLSWKKSIIITYSSGEVAERLKQQYKKYGSQLRVPGFRPGKAPESLIKTRFGDAIKTELIEELSNEGFRQAVKEHKIRAVNTPQTNPPELEEDQDLTITIEVEVVPEFELLKYTGFQLEKTEYEISETDVQRYIDQFLGNYADYVPVERPIQNNDYVVIEYHLEGHEEPTEDAFVLDQNKNKELFESLKEARIGETRKIKVLYSDEYDIKEKANTTGEVEAKVVEIKAPQLPELNMDFLKSKNLGFESVDEFIITARKGLESLKLKREIEELDFAVTEQLIQSNPLELPPTLEIAGTDQILSRHWDLDKLSADELSELQGKFKPAGIRLIKRELILNKLIKQEDLIVSKEELETRVREIAEQRGLDFNKFYMEYRSRGYLDNLKDDLLQDKAIKFVAENSTFNIKKQNITQE